MPRYDFTEQEIEKILDEFSKGHSIEELALKYEAPKTWIANQIKRYMPKSNVGSKCGE